MTKVLGLKGGTGNSHMCGCVWYVVCVCYICDILSRDFINFSRVQMGYGTRERLLLLFKEKRQPLLSRVENCVRV